jgi:hypothetical protein
MESFGKLLIDAARHLSWFIQLAFNLIIGAFVVLLLLRWVTDRLQINPFGRIAFYLRRATNDLIYYARNSRFYLPLKQAVGFDPSFLMALLALGLIWFLVPTFLGSIPLVLSGIGMALRHFAFGAVSKGVSALIGSLLLGLIFFLMALMVILFVNWVSGALNRAANEATYRLAPLLRTFEFGGVMAGWSFPLLWIALYLASSIVRSAFFKS